MYDLRSAMCDLKASSVVNRKSQIVNRKSPASSALIRSHHVKNR